MKSKIIELQDYFKKNNWLENIYLFILGSYLLRAFFDTTLFDLTWSNWYYDSIHIALILIYLLKIVIKGYRNIRECLFDIVYFIIFFFIYQSTDYRFLVELGFFVLLARGIPYKKILKVYLLIGGGVICITILAALTGCITDLVYFERNSFKHAFGIVYTTDFGAHLLFLILAYLAVREKAPSILENGVLSLLAYMLYKYSGTRTTSGVLILLILGGLYIWFTDKYLKNERETTSLWKKIRFRLINFIDVCLSLSVPLFALVSLLPTIYYSPNNDAMNKINIIVTGRLELGNVAVQKYGFSLWGRPFEMIGSGGNVVSRAGYNFVDSSYVMIFIRYGTVLLVLTVLGLWWISIKAKIRKNRYFLIILCAMALSSVIEHHLLELAYNVFILLVFADFPNSYDSKQVSVSIKNIQKVSILKYCLTFGGILILGIKGNKILAYARTLVTLLSLNKQGRNIYFIYALLVGGIVIVATGIMIWRLFSSVLENKNKKSIIKYGFSTMFCVILILIAFQTSNKVILNRAEKYKDAIGTNNVVLKQLAQVDGYKLYIDQLPYLYLRRQKSVEKIVQGNLFTSPEEKAVIITDISNEMPHLIRAGYVCGKISEFSYLYTNDESVTNILRKNGIEMNQYYAEKRSVDLLDLATANGLAVIDTNGLLIEGESKSLIHGPWITIYRGRIRVDYELELLDTDMAEGEVAVSRLSSDWGRNILQEMVVNKSDFDENEKYVVSIVCDIPDLENAEFLLFAKGNAKLKLSSLKYGKVNVE